VADCAPRQTRRAPDWIDGLNAAVEANEEVSIAGFPALATRRVRDNLTADNSLSGDLRVGAANVLDRSNFLLVFRNPGRKSHSSKQIFFRIP